MGLFSWFYVQRFFVLRMELFTLTFCVATCVIICAIYTIVTKLVRRQEFYKQACKFRGPRCLPIIGNAHLFIGNTEAMLNRLNQLLNSYPTPFRIWMGPYLGFFVATPEQCKIICLSSKTIDKGKLFAFGQPWLGTGLITASAAKWRVHRKLIVPTFHADILQSFIEIFAAQSVIMTKEMERHLGGPEFEIYNYLSMYALNSICETTMGAKLGTDRNSRDSYVKAAEQVIASVVKRIFSLWLYPDFIFYRTKLGKAQQKNIKFLHAFTDNIIKMKKKEFLEGRSQQSLAGTDNDECNSTPRRKAFLDHFIELSCDKETLSDEALREEVDTIMVAGSDTTAVVTSFVVLMLASHPEVQEKVYEELCEIYGNEENENLHITRENLNRMKYLEQVIRETMRVLPIGPYMIRTVTDDLNIGEHTFPKGSQVVLAIIDLHRNEKYWPDPFKFDPDRFLPERVAERDPYTYLPFSGGLRNCIGSKYAMLSMKTLMATVLHKYVLKKDHVVPVKDIRLKMEFIMRPVDPITIRIEKRTRKDASV